MFMPEKMSKITDKSPFSNISYRLDDLVSSITEFKYWRELQVRLGIDKVLGKKQKQLQAPISGHLVDAGVKTYEMWGIKDTADRRTLRAAVAYRSLGTDSRTFDEDPVIAEEELKGDPNQQAKNLLDKLHKNHDRV